MTGGHDLKVDCFNAGGDPDLSIKYEGPNISVRDLSRQVLFRE